MSTSIPDSHKDLLGAPVFVNLITLMPDGQPQASVVWCSYDGEHVLVNTAVNRQKEKNMRRRPMATILATDPKNPYRYLEIRGTVTEITEDGAMNHINELAKAYMNAESYYGGVTPAEQAQKETRVLCKIKPARVNAFG